MLGIEPGALGMLGKHSINGATPESPSTPPPSTLSVVQLAEASRVEGGGWGGAARPCRGKNHIKHQGLWLLSTCEVLASGPSTAHKHTTYEDKVMLPATAFEHSYFLNPVIYFITALMADSFK